MSVFVGAFIYSDVKKKGSVARMRVFFYDKLKFLRFLSRIIEL